jgi:DNA replication protein DnaC
MESIKIILAKSPKSTPDPKIYKEEEGEKEKEAEQWARRLSLRGVNDPSHTFDSMERVMGFSHVLDAWGDMMRGKFQLLMIYGGVGNGKTRFCEAIVIEATESGLFTRRDRWSDLVRTMKSHFNGRGEMSYEEYFSDLRSRETLIIDDVGSGSTLGSWEWGELEDIIDYRYERKLFTIVTTNLDIKAFPDRILSRFRDKNRARLVFNEAVDQRPTQTVQG